MSLPLLRYAVARGALARAESIWAIDYWLKVSLALKRRVARLNLMDRRFTMRSRREWV